MRQRVAVGCAAALLLGTATAAASAAPGPEDAPSPSERQLAQSVTTFRPGGVTTWQIPGSVTSVESERSENGETVLSLDSDILFAFASAELPAPASARIAELVAGLPRDAAVAVTGHTDSIGDPASNLRLSQARAQSVAAVVAAARPDLRLTVAGRGEQDPVAPNTSGGKDDPEGRQKNRRVELRYAG